MDVGQDQVPGAGLGPGGAERGTDLVLVAVGQAGDAMDGAGVQGAAADRGGDQWVALWGALSGLSDVQEEPAAPRPVYEQLAACRLRRLRR